MEQNECAEGFCVLPTEDDSSEGQVKHPLDEPKLPSTVSADDPLKVVVDFDSDGLFSRIMGPDYKPINSHDAEYLFMLVKVLNEGKEQKGRTNERYKQLIGESMSFDLSKGFPLFTHRRIAFKLIKSELFWMLKGRTDIAYLHDHDNHIWDYDFTKHIERSKGQTSDDLGPIYGKQWRHFTGDGVVDQLRVLVDGLIKDPFSRRHIVTAWNPTQLTQMALPPCHTMFQVHVEEDDRGTRVMHMTVNQRSADAVLGVPFNVASYALLLHLLCEMLRDAYSISPGILTFFYGNLHIYSNHYDGIKEILKERSIHPPPTVAFTSYDTSSRPSTRIVSIDSIDRGEYTEEDIVLCNYKHSGLYQFPMATY